MQTSTRQLAMLYQAAIVLVLISASSSFLFGQPDWNGLKVTWGLNPFTSFNSQPRTVSDALDEGFVQVGHCNGSAGAKHRGAPFVKDGDTSLVLLFDRNGFIAGIQTRIPKGLSNGYPSPNIKPPFIEMDDGYYLTVYFVPPETICSTGRTDDEYSDQGTGTVLLIQNGANPDTDYMNIPKREQDLPAPWVGNKCFVTMGRHYWYDVSADMDCDNFFPVFLMYNDDELNAFGWAMGADLPSPHMEHPNARSLRYFFENPPRCLRQQSTLSTLHIYLTSSPRLNFC